MSVALIWAEAHDRVIGAGFIGLGVRLALTKR